MELSGAVVPMATPITADREVDLETLETFTDSLVDAGVHGLFPGSSIGEFPSLTREQNRAIVETVVDTAADRTTVLAGCCDTNVEDVVDHIDVAADCGADAGVVVTPYYLRTTQGGLERFYREETIAAAREEADEIREQAREDAEVSAQERLEDARDEIEAEHEELIEQGENAREELAEQAAGREDEVVDYVTDLFEEAVHAQT